MKTKHFNKENINQQLIIAACANLVEEGLSAREVFELLEEMKGQLWSALRQIEMERGQ